MGWQGLSRNAVLVPWAKPDSPCPSCYRRYPEFPNRSLPTTGQFLVINSQLRKFLFTNLTWVNWKITVTSDLGWWKIWWKRKKSHQSLFGTFLVETSRRLTTCTEKMVLVSWLGRCFGNSKDGLFMVSGFSIGSCTCRWWSEPVHKLCPKLNPKSRSILRGIEIDQCKFTRFCSGDRKISSSAFRWFQFDHRWCDPYPFSHSQVLWLWFSI